MKHPVKIVACLLLTSPAFAMTPKTNGSTTRPGWVRHAVPGAIRDGESFTIAMPADLHFKPSRSVDSYVAQYERADISIVLDFGVYGDSRCGNDCQTLDVDGTTAHRMMFIPERKDRIGIFYYVPIGRASERSGQLSVTMTALCSGKASCDTADAIIHSIRLLPAADD